MVNWSDAWNVISGVIGLTPCALGYVYHRLPSYLFRVVDDALKETESLLSSSLEDGLIPDSGQTLKFTQSAEQLRTRAERMRPRVYRATSYWLELRSIAAGLSREISELSAEVLDLRAEVSATISSSRERLREEAELASPQDATGTVADADGASASDPLGGSGTAASRFYNLARERVGGSPGSEATLIDENEGPRLSGAETAHTCCCVGNGLACGPYVGSSRPRVITRSYSTPALSLPFSEAADADHDRAARPTLHDSALSASTPDTPPDPSDNDMPSCNVSMTRDVRVARRIESHRSSR